MGGEQAEYRVEIDPVKLGAYGLTFAEVAKAISASNVLQAVGRLEDHYKLYLMLSDTRIRSLEQIRSTVLRSGTEGLVRLDDLARIYPAATPQWLKVTADGKEAVLVQIYQQPGGNTVQIVQGLRRGCGDQGKLPPEVNVANWYDQSQLITESAGSVRDAILIGVVLAALVLLIFLRSLKITLIAIAGRAGGAGHHRPAAGCAGDELQHHDPGRHGGGGRPDRGRCHCHDRTDHPPSARTASGDRTDRSRGGHRIHPSLAGSSGATVIIFIPLALLSGVTGAFFKALSLTMASSLVISFLLAWLAIPLLAEHLLHQRDAEREDTGPRLTKVQRLYRRS